MANICRNEFYAESPNPKTIDQIYEFLNEEFYYNALDKDLSTVEGEFDSRWTFPEEKMEDLLNIIEDKEELYMRCLSVEYGCEYVAFHKYEGGDKWIQIV